LIRQLFDADLAIEWVEKATCLSELERVAMEAVKWLSRIYVEGIKKLRKSQSG
jgi:hypothetical protein